MASSPIGVLDTSVGNTTLLGTALFTDYLYSFEIAGFILLLAIVVSISLTLRRREGLKRQIVSKQVNIDPTKRMKLVDLKSDKN
jgi:NADH-quinone oxidoreductase subunit J